MEYTNSILPKEGSYYTLQDANISGGILHISPGGSARYEIVETDIVNLTEYFRVSLMLDNLADRYDPDIKVTLRLRTFDDNYFNVDIYPTYANNSIFTQEVQLQAGAYKSFVFEVTSEKSVSISLWELCPEASDVDITTIIEGVEQSLPRLLFDYNTEPIEIRQKEKSVGIIAYRLLDHTDLQGHFQMSYVASDACTLTLRFKDDGTTELFSPLTYDIKPGKGSVGVPHAYLKRLAGIHTATVTAQVTTGSLSIGTRGILFTIDGGYLAHRLIDVTTDMRDMTIRQLSMDRGPDEIWIVGIEEDVGALVYKRKYSFNASIGMEPQFSLGKAIEAAIEFDGDWILRPTDDNYTLETSEKPWCFWVDPEHNLYAQLGDDSATRVLLDTGVDNVNACRGYKSLLYPEQDQGIVCVYVKDKQAYYRQYRYSEIDNKVIWDYANAVDESLQGVTHASVGRLNDYRIQITIVHSGGVSTYISDRTYVGQSVPAETADLTRVRPIPPIACMPSTYDDTLTCVSNTVSDDRLVLTATFDKCIYIIEPMTIDRLLTYNDGIKTDQVDKIVVERDEENQLTHIKLHLNKAPLKLITEMYLNVGGTAYMQYRVDTYGYKICPNLTIQWDTTNYMKHSVSDTATLPAGVDNTRFIPTNKVPVKVEDYAYLVTPVDDTRYIPTNKVPLTTPTEVVRLTNNITSDMIYSAVVDNPI